MKTSVLMLAVLAIFGAVYAETIGSSEVFSVPETRIFEKKVRKIIEDLRQKLKKNDPLDLENVDLEHEKYWIKATELFVENFTEFEVTHLKISIFKKVEIDFKLTNKLSAIIGPFKAGSPRGDIYSSGKNYLDVEGGTLKIRAKVQLKPLQLKDLSFTLQVNGATAELNGINDDAELTEKLNQELAHFLTVTVNDREWHKSVANPFQNIINKFLKNVPL